MTSCRRRRPVPLSVPRGAHARTFADAAGNSPSHSEPAVHPSHPAAIRTWPASHRQWQPPPYTPWTRTKLAMYSHTLRRKCCPVHEPGSDHPGLGRQPIRLRGQFTGLVQRLAHQAVEALPRRSLRLQHLLVAQRPLQRRLHLHRAKLRDGEVQMLQRL